VSEDAGEMGNEDLPSESCIVQFASIHAAVKAGRVLLSHWHVKFVSAHPVVVAVCTTQLNFESSAKHRSNRLKTLTPHGVRVVCYWA
jgi:hypothetical protein